jgi:hypothetical protein
MMGVLLGAILGTRLMPRVKSTLLRRLFVIVMLFVSIQMTLKGLGIQF